MPPLPVACSSPGAPWDIESHSREKAGRALKPTTQPNHLCVRLTGFGRSGAAAVLPLLVGHTGGSYVMYGKYVRIEEPTHSMPDLLC